MGNEIMAERIKAARKAKHLNQKEFAKLIGVSFSSVQKYEMGLVQPRPDVLNRICEVLNCKLFYLMGLSESSEYSKQEKDKFFVADFVRWLGYKTYQVDNEVEEIGRAMDGTPVFMAKDERIGIEDIDNKKKYIVLLKDWEKMKEHMTFIQDY